MDVITASHRSPFLSLLISSLPLITFCFPAAAQGLGGPPSDPGPPSAADREAVECARDAIKCAEMHGVPSSQPPLLPLSDQITSGLNEQGTGLGGDGFNFYSPDDEELSDGGTRNGYYHTGTGEIGLRSGASKPSLIRTLRHEFEHKNNTEHFGGDAAAEVNPNGEETNAAKAAHAEHHKRDSEFLCAVNNAGNGGPGAGECIPGGISLTDLLIPYHKADQLYAETGLKGLDKMQAVGAPENSQLVDYCGGKPKETQEEDQEHDKE